MKSAEILRPLTFAINHANLSLPKKQSEEGEIRREKKLCSKAAVQYTFCGGKASVKVRTGSEKMWYNISAEKNGKTERMQKDSGKFYY